MNPRFKAFIQGTNQPLANGLVYFYLTGTGQSTLQSVFSDIGCTTPLSNPVVLDVNGEAEIYGNMVYDIVIKDSNLVLQDTMLGISFAPANVTTGSTESEWVASNLVPTYVNTTTFTVLGNQTGLFPVNRRIRATITSGTLIYATVTTVTYNSGPNNTTVVITTDAGSLDSGLSAIYYGILNSVNFSIPIVAMEPTLLAYMKANLSLVPVGAVMAFPVTTAPTGYLELNGALVSRTTYADLWTFAQASGNIVSEATWSATNDGSFSTGDLTTNFRLPDYRGQFLRGWDHGRGVDGGRGAGTQQADDFKSHTHRVGGAGAGGGSYLAGNNVASGLNATSEATGGSETRPVNVPLMYCIKWQF